ncbi:MAG: hypothetical protein LBK43_00965 [Treponema sp.]|jgi:hypothetical protein|nr:hypothetical protein [Treponema sp.]
MTYEGIIQRLEKAVRHEKAVVALQVKEVAWKLSAMKLSEEPVVVRGLLGIAEE